MGVILLEALAALILLGAIVWWTMFAGRPRGERRPPAVPAPPSDAPSSAPSSGDGPSRPRDA